MWHMPVLNAINRHVNTNSVHVLLMYTDDMVTCRFINMMVRPCPKWYTFYALTVLWTYNSCRIYILSIETLHPNGAIFGKK